MTPRLLPELPVWLDVSDAGPMAGRASEKRSLDEAWDRAIGSRRQIILVGGAPGVGKSRLAAEAATAAHRAGAVVLHGTCHADYARPFEPFVDLLARLAGHEPALPAFAGVHDAAQHLLASLSPTTEERDPAHRTQRRAGLFDDMAGLLAASAEIAPTIVVLDDIHWASVPTLELISHLARALSRDRLMVMATFRTTLPERTETLTRILVEIHHQPDVLRLDLDGLTTADIGQFISDRTGQSPSSAAPSATLLRDWTAGNPFYVTEIWHAAAVRDVWSDLSALPSTVGDAIRARLTDFDQQARYVIAAAALSSDGIDASLLARVLAAEPSNTQEALDRAVSSGLMTVRESVRYLFVHDLARRALAETLAPSERSRLHGAFADVLEAASSDDPALASRIAHHYAQSGNRAARTVEYATKAAEFAERTLAFEEAAAHFDSAAKHADETAVAETLLLRSAENSKRAAQYEAALERYAAVSKSADPTRRALAAIGHADTIWRPGHLGHESVAMLGSALDRLSPDGDELLNLELRAYLSRSLGYAGAHAAAARLGEDLLVDARRAGDARLLAQALLYPVYATPSVSRLNLDRILEAVALLDPATDLDLAAQASFVCGTTAYALGDPTTWHRAVADLVSIADRSGQPLHRVGLLNALTSLAFCRGEYAEALGTADKTLEYAERFGAGGVGGLHGSATFMVKRETGLEEIRPFITGDPNNEVGTWGLGLLAVYTELGMERAALTTLDTLMETGESSGAAGRYEGGQAAFLAEAVFMLRHREYADALFEILRPRAGTNLLSGHFVNVFGSADRYLGMLASLLGRDAGEHFEAAIEMDRGMGSTHHQAESQARYAQWLRPHDPARATELAGQALATAHRMGSTRIQRMLEPRRGQKDSPLTPRELEVLQLVARGYSNHAISQELFISQNTAANHVRNILIKTDSDNRTQAARYASDRRLFDD